MAWGLHFAPLMVDTPDASHASPQAAQQRRFLRQVLIVVGVVGLVAIALVIFGLAWTAVLTIFGGILIGVLLHGVAQKIADWTRMPRLLALALVLLLVLGAMVGAGFLIGPALLEHVDDLRQQLSIAWQDLRTWAKASPWGSQVYAELSTIEPSSLMTPRFGGFLSTTVGAIGALMLIAVFGLYFAIDPTLYMQGAARLFPPSRRERVLELFRAIGRALRSWFVGRFLSMLVVGMGTSLGLWAVGVPLALPLGIIAGLLSFVPNLGPIMSAIPGALIGLSVSPAVALWAILVYVAVQILESYAITPIIQQRVVSIPPALSLAFQLLMGLSAGIIGLFMATPLLIGVVVCVQSLYLRDVLHDEVSLI
jgi:predicted PurR-regulated permease PerM